MFIYFLHLFPPGEVADGISYFRRRHGHALVKLYQGGDADGAVVGGDFERVGHAVEVVVRLGVDETESARRVFPVFQRLDVVYAAAMPCQAAYGEVRPVEKRVQLLAVLCPVQGDERLQAVAADGRRDFFRFAPAARFAYQVEADFIFGMAAVILSQTFQQAVEAVPEVDFGNSYQVQLSGRAVPGGAQGDAVEIYSVGYADGGAAEYALVVGEGDDEIDVLAEGAAEQFVRIQLRFLPDGSVFVVVGVCGYLQQHADALLFQRPHEVYGEGVGVVVGTDIDAPDAFPADVSQDGGERQPLFELGGYSLAQIGEHFFVCHPLTAAVAGDLVAADADIRPALPEGVRLVADFLADTVVLLESVEDEEKDFHGAAVI